MGFDYSFAEIVGMVNESSKTKRVDFNSRRIGMRKLMGILLVAAVIGFVAPGAFAATSSGHRHQQHQRHHQKQTQKQRKHHVA